jgi:hypothetical protein
LAIGKPAARQIAALIATISRSALSGLSDEDRARNGTGARPDRDLSRVSEVHHRGR